MQVTFLLNQKTRHWPLYDQLLVSAKRCNIKTRVASFKISEKSKVPNREEIKETIFFLEQIVKTLEKEVHELRQCTNALKTFPPAKGL